MRENGKLRFCSIKNAKKIFFHVVFRSKKLAKKRKKRKIFLLEQISIFPPILQTCSDIHSIFKDQKKPSYNLHDQKYVKMLHNSQKMVYKENNRQILKMFPIFLTYH